MHSSTAATSCAIRSVRPSVRTLVVGSPAFPASPPISPLAHPFVRPSTRPPTGPSNSPLDHRPRPPASARRAALLHYKRDGFSLKFQRCHAALYTPAGSSSQLTVYADVPKSASNNFRVAISVLASAQRRMGHGRRATSLSHALLWMGLVAGATLPAVVQGYGLS